MTLLYDDDDDDDDRRTGAEQDTLFLHRRRPRRRVYSNLIWRPSDFSDTRTRQFKSGKKKKWRKKRVRDKTKLS